MYYKFYFELDQIFGFVPAPYKFLNAAFFL